MQDKLRKTAEKNFKDKQAFYIVVATFVAISILLMVVSFTIVNPVAVFWIRFPIIVLALVLGIVYVSMFGFSLKAFANKADWEEEQIDKEMRRLYQQRRNELPSGEELSNEDELELKELERLKNKWYDYDEFV